MKSFGIMDMLQEFDVVIIGAGPSGSTAGKVLADAGAKVMLIDKHIFPREKVCGGLLTAKTIRMVETELKAPDISGIVEDTSSGYQIYKQKSLINSVSSGHSISFVSRKRFDAFLLEKAVSSGCRLIAGQQVLNFGNDQLNIKNERIHFRYLIGADGVHSLVGRKIGRGLSKGNLAVGFQICIPKTELPLFDNWVLPIVYFGYIKYGWAWIFPRGEKYAIGIGGLPRPNGAVRAGFLQFLKDLDILQFASKYKIRTAWLPYGAYLKRPAQGNTFLVGDAAGFVDPITGEGLYYALMSGVMAAESILAEANAPDELYCQRCESNIINRLRQSTYVRPFLFMKPFCGIALNRFRRHNKYMMHFMELLSEDIDYFQYFKDVWFGSSKNL